MRTCVADLEGFTGIPELDERFEVSDTGEIWTKPYTKKTRNRYRDIEYVVPARRLKTRVDPEGYEVFDASIKLNGVNHRKLLRVHRAVIHAFKGKIAEGMQVNHKNGNKLDNYLDNLEVVTPQENVLHSYRLGLATNANDRHPRSLYTDAEVLDMRKMREEGMMYKDIWKTYGSRGCVSTVEKAVLGLNYRTL